MGGCGWNYHESMNIKNSRVTNGYSFNVNGNFAKPSSGEILGSIFGSVIAGVGGAMMSGAVANMEQQQAVDAALAQARATISSCTSDINSLKTEIMNDYGITVNDDGTVEGDTFATRKADIEQEIKDLKTAAGLDDDGANVAQHKADLAEYNKQQRLVTSMERDLPRLQNLDTEFEKTPENIRGQQMINKNGDGTWTLNTSINASNFASPKKDGTNPDGEVLLGAAKSEATALINTHNNEMKARDQILARHGVKNSTELENKLNTEKEKLNNMSDATKPDTKKLDNGMTMAEYNAQMKELNTQLSKFSSPADFNAKVSQIKTLNSQRNMAQSLINSKAALDKAKATKKATTKGSEARTIAKSNYKSAEEQFAAAWKQTVGTNYLTKSQINQQVGAMGLAYGMNGLEQGLWGLLQ